MGANLQPPRDQNICRFHWRKVHGHGPIPDPRSGHRIVVWESNLYSLGGYNPKYWEMENQGDTTNYPLFMELWKFNLSTHKWTRLRTTGPMPKELASHAITLYGHHLVMTGGTGIPFGEASSNNVYVCNLKTLHWCHLECEGAAPNPSYGHAMRSWESGVLLFGGTSGWMYNSEVHTLDLQLKKWSYVETNGDIPEGRYRHEIGVHNKKLYVFGGGRSDISHHFQLIPVLDLELLHWSSMKSKSDPVHGYPSARRCHAAVQLKQYSYICGGYNGEVIFGDLWQLDLDTLQWRLVPAEMPEPAYFHDATITEEGQMLIFGGVTRIDVQRTANVYSIWLQVPSLKEQCWNRILKLVPNIDTITSSDLKAAGIPTNLVERLS